MAEPQQSTPLKTPRNGRVVFWCLATVVIMVAASFAAIPLYQEFCRATGFGGATKVGVKAPGAVEGGVFTIRFDANVAPGLPWRFAPAQREVKIKPGEQAIAFYKAESESNEPTAGQAVYNVTPELAGQYFTKIACFCFNEQHLAAGQKVDMPVTFYVDPAILKDPDLKVVRSITLSYTFFPAPTAKPQAEAAPGARTDKEWGNGARRG
jgi:cytochrome c oxidase assembly protein subunit 11